MNGKLRHVTKRTCRKRRVSSATTRRTVQTVSAPQPTFVVPPPPTFVVVPPPPTVAIAPPPVIIVNVAVAPVGTYVERDDRAVRSAKHEKQRKSRGKGRDEPKSKGKDGRDD